MINTHPSVLPVCLHLIIFLFTFCLTKLRTKAPSPSPILCLTGTVNTLKYPSRTHWAGLWSVTQCSERCKSQQSCCLPDERSLRLQSGALHPQVRGAARICYFNKRLPSLVRSLFLPLPLCLLQNSPNKRLVFGRRHLLLCCPWPAQTATGVKNTTHNRFLPSQHSPAAFTSGDKIPFSFLHGESKNVKIDSYAELSRRCIYLDLNIHFHHCLLNYTSRLPHRSCS